MQHDTTDSSTTTTTTGHLLRGGGAQRARDGRARPGTRRAVPTGDQRTRKLRPIITSHCILHFLSHRRAQFGIDVRVAVVHCLSRRSAALSLWSQMMPLVLILKQSLKERSLHHAYTASVVLPALAPLRCCAFLCCAVQRPPLRLGGRSRPLKRTALLPRSLLRATARLFPI